MNNSVSAQWQEARVPAILAGFAMLGSLVTLAGWAFNVLWLADWDLDGIAQMPNNAFGIAIVSAGLICALFEKRRAGRILGVLAALIAFATLYEHATGVNLGIDTLLFYRDWGQRGTMSPGRMGLPGSISLAVIGVAIVLRTFEKTRRGAVAGGLTAISIAMLSLIGYTFKADPLYMVNRFTTIALQTSTMLLVLGAALVASVPEFAPMRLMRGDSGSALIVRRALPAVVLVPIIVGWLRMVGQEAGLFDTAFGTALLVLTLIAMLVALLLWAAAVIFRHERALREGRDRLAGILGSITDAFMTFDENWRVIFANVEAESLFGRSRADVIGRPLWDLLPAAAGGAAAHEPLRRAMAERVSVEYEVFYPSTGRWFANHAYPTGDEGLAVYARDITEQKSAEQTIRDSEKKFALLFEKAAFGAALATLPDGAFIDVNESFTKLFGYTREEVKGKTSFDLGINRDGAGRALIAEQLQRDGTIRDLELKLYTRDGEERTFLNNITIVELEGKKHLLTTIQDITARKAAEEALRRSAEALLAADRMKDEFLATLSHELRTPLTAIIGWSQIALDGELAPHDLLSALRAIRSSAQAQAQLIEDVLDVSRIITGKMRLQRAETDVQGVIEAAVATVRPAAEAKRIAVRLELAPTLPLLFIDPERIQQVVWNLLSNAIKFSPRGTTVELSARIEDHFCVIEVADEGIGIAPDFLPHVFERFRQADSSATRLHAGLGIGLALSKDLVELHGGIITAESEPGRGSRFTVSLPLPLVHQPSERSPVYASTAGATTLNGVRVLYVDDREDARVLISTMLKQHGAETVVAGSVDDALVALEREPPHIVVTDLAMPERDGYALLAAIQSDGRWKDLPVLALTAEARMNDESRASVAGFRAFLRKPIESHELAAAVSRVMTSVVSPES